MRPNMSQDRTPPVQITVTKVPFLPLKVIRGIPDFPITNPGTLQQSADYQAYVSTATNNGQTSGGGSHPAEVFPPPGTPWTPAYEEVRNLDAWSWSYLQDADGTYTVTIELPNTFENHYELFYIQQ